MSVGVGVSVSSPSDHFCPTSDEPPRPALDSSFSFPDPDSDVESEEEESTANSKRGPAFKFDVDVDVGLVVVDGVGGNIGPGSEGEEVEVNAEDVGGVGGTTVIVVVDDSERVIVVFPIGP